MKYLFLIFMVSDIFAADYLYLRNVQNCFIKKYDNGKFINIPKNKFANVPLEARQIARNSKYISFKIDEKVYVASTNCTFLANDDNPEIQTLPQVTDSLNNNKVEISESDFKRDQLSTNLEKYFLEVGGGLVNISDQNQIPIDYNILFPSDPANPTHWSEADKSVYKSTMLVNIGFGKRVFDDGFIAFKIRAFKGSKIDTLSLTNINANTTVVGNWNYNELLTNYYAGYKYLFSTDPMWIPTLAGYIGLSTGSTVLSDGTTSYNFTSSGTVALFEVGLEYLANPNFGFGVNLGYEHIGARTLQPKNGGTSVAGSDTKLNYSNISATLGVKSYF